MFGSRHRHDFEIREIVPVRYPVGKQALIVTFHELKTPVEIRFDPASPIVEPFGHHAPALAKPPVHRRSIAIAKSLNDHEEHAAYASSRLSTMDALVPPKPNEFDNTQLSFKLSRRSRTIGMSANAGSRFSMLALSQMKPLFIISSE